jgi:hypothetical protein
MISWQRDLEDASSALEVVQLARRYIAGMAGDAFAQLPEDCRPSFISSAEDVHEWSARLDRAYWQLRASARNIAPIQETWSFFLRARTRLSRIEAETALSS